MILTSEERRKINRGCSRRGKEGQRDLFRLLCAAWALDPGRDSGTYTQDHPDCRFAIGPAVGHHIEGKKWSIWRPRAWIRQAERDAGKAPWIIGFKRPGPRWRRFASEWYVLTPKTQLETTLFRRIGGPGNVVGRLWPITAELAFDDVHLAQRAYSGFYTAHIGASAKWDLETWIQGVENVCCATAARQEQELDWVMFLERPGDLVLEEDPKLKGRYLEIGPGGDLRPMMREVPRYHELVYAVLSATTWARVMLEAWQKSGETYEA